MPRTRGVLLLCVSLVVCAIGRATLPGQPSSLRTYYVAPTRIVWQSVEGVVHAESLLLAKPGQTMKPERTPPCALTSTAGKTASILLDFGTELQGGIELFVPLPPQNATGEPRVRVRFGESVSEAMAELDDRHAGNDYALRDQVETLPWLGSKLVGQTGFRFVRIDALDSDQTVLLTQVRALLTLRDAPYVGSFRCSDDRLNKIWDVGAYTVQLNMQEFLWDGIKRDRMVWLGDCAPEVAVIQAVFGANEVVPRSMDLVRDNTPLPKWMNGISSYSLWWIVIQDEWYRQNGDRAYLEKQRGYLQALLKQVASSLDANGRETLTGFRYLDWPTIPNQPGTAAGLQALVILSLDAGTRLSTALGDSETATLCTQAVAKARTVPADAANAKSAAALQVLAGTAEAKKTARDILLHDGPKEVSAFGGYAILRALGQANETDAALDLIRTYWGGMVDRGATTFWEEFDVAWLEGTGRIDEPTPAGLKDLHGDTGQFGYEGFRKSLCHGWSAGPTAWMIEHVLGIQPLKPGCAQVLVAPHLGKLEWAEGSYPTPRGPITVRHERQPDGSVKSTIHAPPGVEVVRSSPQSS